MSFLASFPVYAKYNGEFNKKMLSLIKKFNYKKLKWIIVCPKGLQVLKYTKNLHTAAKFFSYVEFWIESVHA